MGKKEYPVLSFTNDEGLEVTHAHAHAHAHTQEFKNKRTVE